MAHSIRSDTDGEESPYNWLTELIVDPLRWWNCGTEESGDEESTQQVVTPSQAYEALDSTMKWLESQDPTHLLLVRKKEGYSYKKNRNFWTKKITSSYSKF